MNFFDFVYNHMNGVYTEQDAVIENMFAKGSPCDRLYLEAYDARIRLSGGDLDAENPDVLCIVEAYEKMQRMFCEMAFQYGEKFAELTKQKCMSEDEAQSSKDST